LFKEILTFSIELNLISSIETELSPNLAPRRCSFIPAPIPTPKLVSGIMSLTFLGDTLDYIKTGLQLFVIIDRFKEHHTALLESACTSGVLTDCDHGITFSDLENFKVP
jgi:hypothetical protein